MASLPSELAARLETAFEEQRDPVRAAGASAYMRDQFAFYGIPAPAQRMIARGAQAGLPRPTEKDLRTIARACWKRAEREWQYFACGYIGKHIAGVGPSFIDDLAWLIRTKSWWDTVDVLAANAVGPLVATYPVLAASLDGWIRSDNIWIARSAILHQLRYRSSTDVDRLFRYCLARADEREFFIRKAIGWALREYSKTDADAVRRFVAENTDRLSNLSRTEALKWLDRKSR
jgi:3-methyladenine DNA glycosylase AlkD